MDEYTIFVMSAVISAVVYTIWMVRRDNSMEAHLFSHDDRLRTLEQLEAARDTVLLPEFNEAVMTLQGAVNANTENLDEVERRLEKLEEVE